MKGFFVTGTDTGVGKTYVTSALARELTGRGLRVAAIKPAESGCRRGPDGDLVADDAERIAEAAGGWQGPDERVFYRFEEPLAPGVAAARAGQELSISAAAGFVRRVAAGADVALVEGAGGWLVPLGGGLTIADLAVALALPVVVVARGTLGTINHSLLTVEAIRRRGLTVAAVVLSVVATEDLSAAAANRVEIERHGGGATWLLSAAGWDRPLGAPLFHVERG